MGSQIPKGKTISGDPNIQKIPFFKLIMQHFDFCHSFARRIRLGCAWLPKAERGEAPELHWGEWLGLSPSDAILSLLECWSELHPHTYSALFCYYRCGYTFPARPLFRRRASCSPLPTGQMKLSGLGPATEFRPRLSICQGSNCRSEILKTKSAFLKQTSQLL